MIEAIRGTDLRRLPLQSDQIRDRGAATVVKTVDLFYNSLESA